MDCILLWSSNVRVHDSQAYRKKDVTRERISCILELRKIFLSFQTGFSLCQCCCCLCYPGEYLGLGTLIRYNWAQVLEACENLKLLSIYFDFCVDATSLSSAWSSRHCYVMLCYVMLCCVMYNAGHNNSQVRCRLQHEDCKTDAIRHDAGFDLQCRLKGTDVNLMSFAFQ